MTKLIEKLVKEITPAGGMDGWNPDVKPGIPLTVLIPIKTKKGTIPTGTEGKLVRKTADGNTFGTLFTMRAKTGKTITAPCSNFGHIEYKKQVALPKPKKTKSIKIKPCKKCGGTNIKLWDCGYSSFNPGGGKCECGHEVQGEAGCNPTQTDLASIWNFGQQLTHTEGLKAEIKKLKAKIRALQKIKPIKP